MVLIYMCDDEEKYTDILSRIIYEYFQKKEIQIVIKTFTDTSEMMVQVKNEKNNIDLFFMDIELGNDNGIEVAERINNELGPGKIIYISSHDEYVYDVFKTSPIDYIRKPFSSDKIFEILDRIKLYDKSQNKISVIAKRKEIIIDIDDICYAESQGRLLCIHLKREVVDIYCKVDEFEKVISEKSSLFIRIHKSILVNYNYIEAFNSEYIEMNDGAQFNISRKYQNEVKNRYIREIKSKTMHEFDNKNN